MEHDVAAEASLANLVLKLKNNDPQVSQRAASWALLSKRVAGI